MQMIYIKPFNSIKFIAMLAIFLTCLSFIKIVPECNEFYKNYLHLKYKVVVVDKQNGDYSTINEAVQKNNGGTIIVMPGDYYENVRAWVNKPINIIGVDKNKCILRHDCGQYANPPLEIAAGYVKNMTIYADSTNPLVDSNDTNANCRFVKHMIHHIVFSNKSNFLRYDRYLV